MSERKFTEDHEWIALEDDIGTVGITAYAQEQLGDVVYVELPEVGRTVAQGEETAVVESVKAASEIYAPATGEVVAVNEALNDDPGLVNRSAMEEGWFMKIKVSAADELTSLMDEAGYQSFVEGLE